MPLPNAPPKKRSREVDFLIKDQASWRQYRTSSYIGPDQLRLTRLAKRRLTTESPSAAATEREEEKKPAKTANEKKVNPLNTAGPSNASSQHQKTATVGRNEAARNAESATPKLDTGCPLGETMIQLLKGVSEMSQALQKTVATKTYELSTFPDCANYISVTEDKSITFCKMSINTGIVIMKPGAERDWALNQEGATAVCMNILS